MAGLESVGVFGEGKKRHLGLSVCGCRQRGSSTSVYLIVDGAATPGARAEAGAWVNTGYNVGNSAGTTGIGLLINRLPLAACFAVAAAATCCPAAALAVSIGKPQNRGRQS